MDGATGQSGPAGRSGPGRDGEEAIQVCVTVFPGGTRDFVLVRRAADGAYESIHPLELLALDRVARRIERVGRQHPALALVLSLCRLLVPCLRDRGTGRELVAEPWSEADLQGQTLPTDVRTPLARELAEEQAKEWRVISTGEQPPEGSLAELFWEAHTSLPLLPDVFDDPDLGILARALYLHLVPDGRGTAEVDARQVKATVEACRAADFGPLGLGLPGRRLRRLFRTLLAVTVRYAGQLTGAAAEDLVRERIGPAEAPLGLAERDLLELRYGACRALGDINIGFVAGGGPLLGALIADYAAELAGPVEEATRADAASRLHDFIGLLASFRRRRKLARAHERREDRQLRADRMPHGPRTPPDNQPDPSSPDPGKVAEAAEELEALRELLPQLKLKQRDRRRLEALLGCGGDRRSAAEQLGLSLEVYNRQLRQTVWPAIRNAFAARQKRQGPGFRPDN